MEDNFIYVFDFIQQEIFKPLINTLYGVEWVENFIDLLNKLLSALFKFETNISIDNLASFLTTIILIIILILVVKMFKFAFNSFFEIGERKKKKRGR